MGVGGAITVITIVVTVISIIACIRRNRANKPVFFLKIIYFLLFVHISIFNVKS